MTELELYKAIINLAYEAELLCHYPITSDLIDAADSLQESMSSNIAYPFVEKVLRLVQDLEQ